MQVGSYVKPCYSMPILYASEQRHRRHFGNLVKGMLSIQSWTPEFQFRYHSHHQLAFAFWWCQGIVSEHSLFLGGPRSASMLWITQQIHGYRTKKVHEALQRWSFLFPNKGLNYFLLLWRNRCPVSYPDHVLAWDQKSINMLFLEGPHIPM